MRILLVGQGGREHAIAAALARSSYKPELFAFMSSMNPGIMGLCQDYTIGKMADKARIADYAWEKRVDFVVIGPEEPLMHGASDELYQRGIPCVGPRQKLAQLEGNKSFLRKKVAQYAPEANPGFITCSTLEEIDEALVELQDIAVKPLGLTGGKGVKVMGAQLPDRQAAKDYAIELLNQDGSVLLEQRLVGEEFSLMVFTDGVKISPMPLIQDAKYAREGDTGPMTGGMGAYSMPDHNLPFITPSARAYAVQLLEKLLKGIQDEYRERYHGILYGQFMLTRQGPFLVEVNVRLGDPEAINAMSILKTDPVDVFMGLVCGLPDKIEFLPLASVCKYLVPEGYPEEKGRVARASLDPRVFEGENTKLIIAGAEKEGNGYVATGSRFAAILAARDKLAEAEEAVERTIQKLNLEGLRYRSDIGKPERILAKQNFFNNK